MLLSMSESNFPQQSLQLISTVNMSDTKFNPNDSTTETLKSASPSLNEKSSSHQDEAEPTSSRPVSGDQHHDLKKVMSAKQAQEELNRVMTSGEGIEYPTGAKLGLITMALCLSVFLMALVSTFIFHPGNLELSALLTLCPGQHHYRNRYSQNHRSISFARRCWMVWFRVPPHNRLLPAPVRQILLLFLHQMGLPHCYRDL